MCSRVGVGTVGPADGMKTFLRWCRYASVGADCRSDAPVIDQRQRVRIGDLQSSVAVVCPGAGWPEVVTAGVVW